MTTHPPRPRRPDDDVPVLVVGAGPAGLAAATALAAHGVRALVVDRRAGVSTQPKATALSLRTAELMRGWGLTEQVRAGSVAVEWRLLAAPTMARAAEGDLVDVGLPTAAQSALV